jgi:acyl carrier protein
LSSNEKRLKSRPGRQPLRQSSPERSACTAIANRSDSAKYILKRTRGAMLRLAGHASQRLMPRTTREAALRIATTLRGRSAPPPPAQSLPAWLRETGWRDSFDVNVVPKRIGLTLTWPVCRRPSEDLIGIHAVSLRADAILSAVSSMTQPAQASIESGVISVLKAVNPRPIEPTLGSDLVADLGFDSLQIMEVIAELEERFDVSIPLNDVPSTRTVSQIVAQVTALVDGRASA